MQPVAALAIGDAAIAAFGLLLGVYEAWLFYRHKGRTEHLWVAAICFATAGYAICMVFHYDASQSAALILTRVEAMMLVIIAYSVPLFAEAFTGKRLPVPRWLVAVLFLAWFGLAGSPWLVTHVDAYNMTLLDHAFWRRPQSGVMVASQVFGFGVVAVGTFWLVKHRATRPTEMRYFLVGLGVWASTSVYMFANSVLGRAMPASVVEYGFVGFALCLVAKDATAFMRMLTESEEKSETFAENFATLVEESPELVAVFRDGAFVYVNPALVSLRGYSASVDLVGRSIDSVFVDDPMEPSSSSDEIAKESRLRTHSGEFIDVELLTVEMKFDGAPAQVALGHNIGERKQLTRRMMELDRIAAVGTLAAGVGHEINNPLSYVVLNLSGADEIVNRVKAGQDTDEDLAELSELIEESAEGARRIRDIVAELRSFSRTSEETIVMSVEDAVDSALKMVGNELRHRAEIVVRHTSTPPVVASRARLSQVILNLLVNAAHAIPETYGTEQKVYVNTYAQDGWAVAEVRDTGPGISAANLERIFEPFFTTKPVGQGTGLGLSICQESVRNMGGRIEVDSKPGHGATFRIHLPSAPTQDEPVRAPKWAPPTKRARLLIVDDQPKILTALRRTLSRDFDVITCQSGVEALEQLGGVNEFDIVLADLMMPGTSGMQLYEQVRERFPSVAPRMLFMTGGVFTASAREFEQELEGRLLAKPLDIDDLRVRIGAIRRSSL